MSDLISFGNFAAPLSKQRIVPPHTGPQSTPDLEMRKHFCRRVSQSGFVAVYSKVGLDL